MTEHRPYLFDGLPVVDATEEFSIQVHRDDLAKGRAITPGRCAINRAAERMPEVIEAKIGSRLSYLRMRTDPDVWIRYRNTDKTTELIRYFDSGTEVVKAATAWMSGVVTIILRVPGPSLRLGYKRGQTGTDSRGDQPGGLHRRPSLRNVTVDPDAPEGEVA
jgi:hypothetical protein